MTPNRASPRGAARASRRREPEPRNWRPLLGVLLVAGLGIATWLALQWYESRHATLDFVCRAGALPPLELTFFPDHLAFTSPSPPAALGKATIDAGRGSEARITVGSDLVQGSALVRYRSAGFATGFVYVKLGAATRPIELHAGQKLEGRVGEPIGFWCFGWRCAGYEPIADAEVTVMGGGEHGVDLVSARTDKDGRFVIDGVDREMDGLGLRVRARGYGLLHQSLDVRDETGQPYPVIALAATQPRVGRILAPPTIDVTRLKVLARGLPGVEAQPASDGQFVLDCIPPGFDPKLIVHGLAGTFAQQAPTTAADGSLRIEIVAAAMARGRVVDAETGAPLADALVFCGEQEAVRADATGHYELPGVLPGDVELRAQWQGPEKRRHREQFYGRRRVTLVAGEEHEVDIPVTTK